MKSKIFILSHSHSGSTLLDLMLGSHNQCSSLGEFVRISDKIKKKLPMCAVCDRDCSVWLKFKQLYRKHSLFDAAFSSFKTPFIIDSSKRVTWAKKHLTKHDYCIHLIRYGLATMLKTKRKKGIIKSSDIQGWINRNAKISKFMKSINKKRRIFIKYEDLVTEPDKCLGKICKFLKIDYDSQMICFEKTHHHVVSGNAKPICAVQLHHHIKKIETMHPDVQDFFSLIKKPVELDTRYQSRFSPSEVELFNRIAGRISNKYGY